ncbi:hypothetical protein HY213_04310 [Candidatus Peregrinibacteria bacterium]|nr:hypothetical protein [Candidatus Peregrinibacteria bacterium]
MNMLPAPDAAPTVHTCGILERVSLPLLLFAGLLTSLLIVASATLLPRLTRIEADGSLYSIDQLRVRRSQLTAQVHTQVQQREALLLPLQDNSYDVLKAERTGEPDLSLLQRKILAQAASLTSTPDAIHLDRLAYRADQKLLVLEGDVRHVGPHCMTLLAAFVDQLMKLADIADIPNPVFTRDDDPATGPHSPFSLILHLR